MKGEREHVCRLVAERFSGPHGLEFQKYNVAPREGVFRVRRKILRQLVKRRIREGISR
jgi:hypothetical protein